MTQKVWREKYKGSDHGNKPDRIFYCESCSNPEPWNVRRWIFEWGYAFCSRYCVEEFEKFLRKLAKKGKKYQRWQDIPQT